MTTVALYGGLNPARIREPAVVGVPRVQITSLIVIGTPSNGAVNPRVATPVDFLRPRSCLVAKDHRERVELTVHRADVL